MIISYLLHHLCIRHEIEIILLTATIYHFEISIENVDISNLINLLNSFPELNSLKIRSLACFDLKNLDPLDSEILYSMEDTSKITKVYIETMNTMDEFDFLLDLCPHMEYFKVDHIKLIDIKLALRYILRKLNTNDNDCLNLLCFRVPTADDEMVRKLNRMIYLEKLLYNYTIKRVADHIYLQWKL